MLSDEIYNSESGYFFNTFISMLKPKKEKQNKNKKCIMYVCMDVCMHGVCFDS